MPISYHTCRQTSSTSEVNSSPVTLRTISTGNSWSYYQNSPGLLLSSQFSETPATPNLPSPPPPTPTFGRMTPQFRTPGSNLDESRSNEIAIRIGTAYATQQSRDGWMISRVTCTFDATANSEESLWTILNLLQSNDRLLCFGVQVESGSLEGPGNSRVWTLTLRIQGLNFGMATEIMNTLSSMNSGEVLTSVTSSDGSIDILYLLRSREAQLYSRRPRYLSPPISIQETGIRTLMTPRRRLFSDVLPLTTARYRSITESDDEEEFFWNS